MNEPEPRRYAFDDFRVDALTRQLSRLDGTAIALTPKAFDTLLYLVQHAGVMLGKDELMAAVWPGRVVEENNLNQNISALRRTLGGAERRYIVTEPGRGYRFVADVRIEAQGASAAHIAQPDITQAAGAFAAEAAGATPAIGTSAPAQPAPALTPPLPASDASPSLQPDSRRLRRSTGFLVLLGALALGGLVAVRYRAHQPPHAASAVASPTLVVLPLRPVGNMSDEATFAEGLSEELITRLAHIEGLRLISRTSAARAQDAKFDLNQLGERLHVTHALEGSLRQSGEQLRIDLRLVEIPGGRTLWAQDYQRKLADVFAIQREIAQSVAQALALKLGAANAAVEADVDPHWFQEYLELRHMMGEEKYLPMQQAAHREFVERLHALVTRAPGYARAHGLLARALVQDLRALDYGDDERAEARKEIAIALQLDPNQIEAHAALASIACHTDDWPRCLDEYRLVLKLDPTDAAMRGAYASRLAYIGYLDEALPQIRMAWDTDPLIPESSVLYPWITDVKGRHDEALLLYQAMPGTRYQRWNPMVWFNAVWRHDYAAARDLAAAMPKEDKYTDSYVAASEALLDHVRWSQVQSRTADKYTSLAQPDLDRETAMRQIDAWWTPHTSPVPIFLWVPEFAHVRSTAAFQDFLLRHHILDYWRSRGFPTQCRPSGDGAQCD